MSITQFISIMATKDIRLCSRYDQHRQIENDRNPSLDFINKNLLSVNECVRLLYLYRNEGFLTGSKPFRLSSNKVSKYDTKNKLVKLVHTIGLIALFPLLFSIKMSYYGLTPVGRKLYQDYLFAVSDRMNNKNPIVQTGKEGLITCNESAPLTCLPVDMKREILSHLTSAKDVANLAKTCKSWSEVVRRFDKIYPLLPDCIKDHIDKKVLKEVLNRDPHFVACLVRDAGDFIHHKYKEFKMPEDKIGDSAISWGVDKAGGIYLFFQVEFSNYQSFFVKGKWIHVKLTGRSDYKRDIVSFIYDPVKHSWDVDLPYALTPIIIQDTSDDHLVLNFIICLIKWNENTLAASLRSQFQDSVNTNDYIRRLMKGEKVGHPISLSIGINPSPQLTFSDVNDESFVRLMPFRL